MHWRQKSFSVYLSCVKQKSKHFCPGNLFYHKPFCGFHRRYLERNTLSSQWEKYVSSSNTIFTNSSLGPRTLTKKILETSPGYPNRSSYFHVYTGYFLSKKISVSLKKNMIYAHRSACISSANWRCPWRLLRSISMNNANTGASVLNNKYTKEFILFKWKNSDPGSIGWSNWLWRIFQQADALI